MLALILKALWTLFHACKKDVFSCAVMALAFLLVFVLNLKAVWVIALCAFLGLLAARGRKVGK